MELMVVVAIVGILAVLAIANYRVAVVRTRISDGISLVAPMKLTVADNLSTNPGGDACFGVVNIVVPMDSVALTRCIDDGTTAKIHIEMTADAADAVVELVSDRTGQPGWDCIADPALPAYDYLPMDCRQ